MGGVGIEVWDGWALCCCIMIERLAGRKSVMLVVTKTSPYYLCVAVKMLRRRFGSNRDSLDLFVITLLVPTVIQ